MTKHFVSVDALRDVLRRRYAGAIQNYVRRYAVHNAVRFVVALRDGESIDTYRQRVIFS